MTDSQKLCFLIKQISEQSDRKMNQCMSLYNITFSQFRVLYCIANHSDTVSQKDIELFLQVAHPTVVGLLNGLEKKGFVYCAFDSADKRTKNVYLTEKAKSIIYQSRNHADFLKNELLNGLDENEVSSAVKILEKIKFNLNNIDGSKFEV